MKLGEVKVAYPFVEYEVNVTHHTERKSTVMEWMLLEIAQQTRMNSDYGNIPLEKILTTIFGVSDSDKLLRQVLIDLVDVGALAQISGFNDQSEWKALRCGDLQLTDNGRHLQKEGKLPAKKADNNLKVIYDVINYCLQMDSKQLAESTICRKVKNISEGDMPGFPSFLIHEQIQKWQENGQGPSWLQSNSHIDDLVPKMTKIKWKNIKHEIFLDGEGNLSFSGVSNGEIAEQVLQTIDDCIMPEIAADALQSKQNCELRELRDKDNLLKRVKDYGDKAEIFAISSLISDKIPVLLEGKSKKVCLLLGQKTFGIDHSGQNLIVSIPDSMEMYYLDRKRGVYSAMVKGHVGDVSRWLPLIYEDTTDFSSFIADLVKKYYHSEPRMRWLLKFVENVSWQEFYTPDYIQELLNSEEVQQYTDIDKILDKLLKLDASIQKALSDVPWPASTETIRRALSSKEAETLRDVHEWTLEWRDAVETLRDKTGVDVRNIDWQETRFGQSLQRMEQATDAVALFFDGTADSYNSVYIFATDALMHYPDVLDDFSDNKALVIIPKQVLAKLDRLKEADGEGSGQQARRAIRKIDEYGQRPWMKQDEDTYRELLSDHLQEDGIDDIDILSVAMKYRVKKPVMVTDDADLQKITKSEGIETVFVNDLHKKLTSGVSVKKKGKNKKGNRR